VKRFICPPVFSILAAVWLCSPVVVSAQSVDFQGDMVAPRITHEVPDAIPRGSAYTLRTVVTDKGGVKEVVLSYRHLGAADYERVIMTHTTDSTYEAVFDASKVVPPSVEYYIEASDTSGNTALRGFAFSPLTVQVSPKAASVSSFALSTGNTETKVSKPWYKKPWVWGLAVGVVGAAVAASTTSEENNTPTGTITIGAPTP